jgi:outer membrane protein assembly factor BamB
MIVGKTLVLNVGSGGIGLNPATGAVLWKSDDSEEAGYSTPVPVKLNGAEQLLMSNGKSYFALEAATGKVSWRFPWKTSWDVNAADPVVVGTSVFVSSGYDTGGALLAFGGEPKAVWTNKVMRNQFNSSVFYKGHLYGIDGNDGKAAGLKCVVAATGEEKWFEKSVGFGSLMLAGSHLLVLTEKGELRVGPASSESFSPTGSAQILSSKCWTAPVLANGILYARNAGGNVVAVDLRN